VQRRELKRRRSRIEAAEGPQGRGRRRSTRPGTEAAEGTTEIGARGRTRVLEGTTAGLRLEGMAATVE